MGKSKNKFKPNVPVINSIIINVPVNYIIYYYNKVNTLINTIYNNFGDILLVR